jgi:molybdopterin molybdotransferase
MSDLPRADRLLPLEALWPTVAAEVRPLETEDVALAAAAGRVLAEPAAAAWDLPPFTNSAMDGWAVRAADTAPGRPLVLAAGHAYAGAHEPPALEPGTALPIGTGGRLPAGADAILCKEEATSDADAVTPLCAVTAGAHVRLQGGERKTGDTVLPAGSRLGPAAVGALAAAGCATVRCARRPRVGILATGSEVAAAGRAPGPGLIADANTPLLQAAVTGLLGEAPPPLPPAPDHPEDLGAALGAALVGRDVLVVTGGVSVGDRDLVRQLVVDRLGAEPLLWRVAVKPGKPVFVARRGSAWIVALPGNPAAVAVHWHLLLKPLLLALQGAAGPEPRWRSLVLGADALPDHERVLLRWCALADEDGRLRADPLPGAESHMLGGAARAEALAALPPGPGPVPKGTVVQGLLLD